MKAFPSDWTTYSLQVVGLNVPAATAPSAASALDWLGDQRDTPTCPGLIRWAAAIVHQMNTEISRSRGEKNRAAAVVLNQNCDLVFLIPVNDEVVLAVVSDAEVLKVCGCSILERVNVRPCAGIQ